MMESPARHEYESFVNYMNTPRVVIDNAGCPTATLVKVDSARREQGVLMDAVQALVDLNLSISKAYLSSDAGRWSMDVFHVVDGHGRKLPDTPLLPFLENQLSCSPSSWPSDSSHVSPGIVQLEFAGADRWGLLSEVFAVLASSGCDVLAGTVWTHDARIAAVILVEDSSTALLEVESRLRIVRLRRSQEVAASAERRLHQLMLADRDYESRCVAEEGEAASPSVSEDTTISVQEWTGWGYSVVTVQCTDRPKLLFDVVCTLTDLKYAIFHGRIDTVGDKAHQEFYIRRMDGSPIRSEAERQRVVQCLKAAIDRRFTQGLRLQLHTLDRRGLLAEVTRAFREYGLLVKQAEITTEGNMATDVFCVTDTKGQLPDANIIRSMIQRFGEGRLRVLDDNRQRYFPADRHRPGGDGGSGSAAGLFSLPSLVWKNLSSLGLIRS